LPTDDQVLVEKAWYPLATEMVTELVAILNASGINQPGSITLRQYLDLRRQASDLVTVLPVPAEPEGRPATTAADLPVGLNATLYPYQHKGFTWLCRIADEGLGCILGDQMGLGKTLQVIALLLRERAIRTAPSLVVAPATLLDNWHREISRFAPSLSVCIHRGHERSGYARVIREYNVVVTSYETAMRDISILGMIDWNVVVLDEAQAIKTPDAQRTMTLKTLPRRAAIAVSGTPVENRLRDLWSLMDFALPGFLGDLPTFESRYSDIEHDAGDLEPLVSPLILRRLVADVAKDLPDRIDIPQAIQLSEEAAARYDAIRAEVVSQYGKAASLVALTRLRMFCTHPFIVDGGTGDPLPHSTKYARLVEILDEIFADNEKVLIFTSYTEMADILAADIRRRFLIPCDVIDGRTPVTDRQPMVDRFGAVMTSAALVLNPKAAGTGLNITAANHVIHYNLEWNPAIEDQATARSHRRGQTRPVTVHRLFHPGTVEEVIDQRAQRKRAIASQAVVGTEGGDEDIADIARAMELSPVLAGADHVP
jgi:SNF2 family DNA or RNA helicase